MSSSTLISGTITLDEAAMAVFMSRPSWAWMDQPGAHVNPGEDDQGAQVTEIELFGTFWDLHAHLLEDLVLASKVGIVTGEVSLQDYAYDARVSFEDGRCWYGEGDPLVMRRCHLVPDENGRKELRPVDDETDPE